MSDTNDTPNDSKQLTEDELSNLLDSAFVDFCQASKNDRETLESKSNNKENVSSTSNETATSESQPSLNDANSPFRLFESDPELKECWSNIIKSCSDQEINDNEFQQSLHHTLRVISEKAKEISGDEEILPEDEIARTLANFAELSGGGGNGDENGEDGSNNFELNKIMPLMSNIMENLLSKDFLYPTLSDLSSKYPIYLKEHKNELPSDEYERYEKQYQIIVEICEKFENETDNETEDSKNVRFNQILALMQRMQTYGTPPAELVSPNSLNPDAMAELNMFNSTDQSKCSIM